MKTLEERLREIPGERFSHETDPTGSTWIVLHDALAIVAEYQSESTEITGTYPELVDGSISSAPGTISFGSENLRYHRGIDAGEKGVAGAPRIYRGEEIKDAPDGLYAIRFRPTGKKARDWTEIYFESTCIRFACRCSDDSGTWEFFGPLPTNQDEGE